MLASNDPLVYSEVLQFKLYLMQHSKVKLQSTLSKVQPAEPMLK